jgi:hypothetical protein
MAILIIIFALSNQVNAEGFFKQAKTLLQECEEKNVACFSYIAGFYDNNSFLKAAKVVTRNLYCGPYQMSQGQLVELFVLFASKNRDKLHLPAVLMPIEPLLKHFRVADQDSACRIAASLSGRRSFVINKPNGIRVSKYYHMPNSILLAVRLYPSVSCWPKAEVQVAVSSVSFGETRLLCSSSTRRTAGTTACVCYGAPHSLAR